MSETDIKIEMMNACKESWLLFFEEKIDRFIKGYEMTKADTDNKKWCEAEDYNAFSNKRFGLRLGSIVNKLSTTINKTHYRYYLIKDSVKNKYGGVKIDLDDITYDF
jgi:hypothetical protein